MNCHEVRDLVHASLDGELDLVRQIGIKATFAPVSSLPGDL